MKALVKRDRQRGMVLEEVPLSPLGSRDARIRIVAASICGTDLHIFRWDRWAQRRLKPPVVFGHEFVGIIEELGSDVTHLAVGDRVSGEGHITCGHCYYCRTGQGHICRDVEIIGVDRDGCFADYLTMPAENLWPVPKWIPDRHASLFDPLGNAMHTVMSTQVAEKSVLITGAGSIGLFAVAISRAIGASKIIVIEPNELKRKKAIDVGADLTYNPAESELDVIVQSETEGMGPEVFFEMSGSAQALVTGLTAMRRGGSAAILGIFEQEVPIDWSELVVFKGLTIHGISGRLMYKTWYQSQSFLTTDGHAIDPVITHEIPFSEAHRGFALMEKGEAIKVILTFS